MCDALATTFTKKTKIEPAETAVAPCTSGDHKTNKSHSPALPDLQNCDLEQFDPTDDKALAEFVTQTEKILAQLEKDNDQSDNQQKECASVPSTSNMVQFNQNTYNPTGANIPIVPRMLFSNSNITVNFNFNK